MKTRIALFCLLAACGRREPVPPVRVMDQVQAFVYGGKRSHERLCFVFLDGSAGCGPVPTAVLPDPEIPFVVDTEIPGPVRDLVMDDLGYCFINEETGITCEAGRPLDDEAAWVSARGVVGLAAAEERICAWTVDDEILCTTGTAPTTGGRPITRVRGQQDGSGICAVTHDGDVSCVEIDEGWEEPYWLEAVTEPVKDISIPDCALLQSGRPRCRNHGEVHGAYDELWEERRGVRYFVNPAQAATIPLLPDEVTYDLGMWEHAEMGMINRDIGTARQVERGASWACALVDDVVYCF